MVLAYGTQEGIIVRRRTEDEERQQAEEDRALLRELEERGAGQEELDALAKDDGQRAFVIDSEDYFESVDLSMQEEEEEEEEEREDQEEDQERSSG